ncbi:alpha-rhamnosidase [Haloferula helveola]|uniref:alpha-L-rhamnosidase n=1 Tax=Haloferula helveola TaxID=490095 RepID=A0ABM7R6U7_9BACT|nr:alpha-rhamnosidase [Haloferula helveola]
MVASSEELLSKDEGDLWDSGKTGTERLPGTKYEGKAVETGTVCHWKVRWWGSGDQPSPWSEPATWEPAPGKPADWKGARWINDGGTNPDNDADFYKPDPAPLMRKEFKIGKPVTRARLHVAGLGLGHPSIDGERLDDHVFDPPWTRFDKRIFFRTHDVTSQLNEGTHCLGIELGNGWYNPLPLRMWGRRNLREALPVGRPRAILCLVAEHSDGTTTVVTSGEEWKTAPGPTLRNSIYLGEERDARLAVDGWSKPGFDDAKWQPVKVAGEPLEPLQPLLMPPVRLAEALPAKAVTSPSEGVHIVDFGTIFTGIPEIAINAPAGTRIGFRFGELLHEDGTLNPMTSVCGQIKGTRKGPDGKPMSVGGPGAPEIAWQQDVYIARGEGERYRPDFTFHSFRYMEVTGLSEVLADTCQAFPMRTDLADTGSFSCSNESLNRIQEMCRRTFLANVVTVQSDCPHRERFGYGGDIVATSEAYLMNFDMASFYAKTVRDWADSALPDGRLTDTAPFVGVDYCGVGWAMVHPLLLEQLYQHYGDRSLIEEQFPVAMKWFEVEAGRRKDNLVTIGLGDHEALDKGRGPAVSTPMFIDTALRMARLAKIIERGNDAKQLEAWAEESRKAWAEAFLSEKGVVADGSQSQLCFALGFHAAPEGARKDVFARLIDNLTAPEDSPRLSTGIYGTRILLEQLSANARSDLAYSLADRDTFPSWKWMLENGATTLWEHWAGSDGTYSNNHPMFGSVSEWFFRWLGGIQCAPDAVGFDRAVIRPQVVGDLTWVKSSHETIRGTITSDWSIDGKVRQFDITIPVGVTAKVELPAKAGDIITESDKPLQDRSDIGFTDRGDGLGIEIGSGSYSFKVTTP